MLRQPDTYHRYHSAHGRFIKPIIEDRAEMVIGNRFKLGMPKNMSPVKYWGNKKISQLISYVCDRKFQDVSCGYRIYSRKALLRFNLFGIFTYTHETILSAVFQGLRILECPISVSYYPERKSRVAASISQYALQTGTIIFRVMLDYRPMRILGSAAGVLTLIGVVFVSILFGHYALTGSFTPYKAFGFIGLGFIIFGMLVFLVALIADMLNRLRTNQDRLLYELRRTRYEK